MEQSGTAETISPPGEKPVSSPPPAPTPAARTAVGTAPAALDHAPARVETGNAEEEPGRTRIETPETVTTDAERQFRGLRFALGLVVAIAVTVILTAIDAVRPDPGPGGPRLVLPGAVRAGRLQWDQPAGLAGGQRERPAE